MLPPRKYPIPNQDINRIITEKYQSAPTHSAKHPPGYKSLLNNAHDTNITEDYCNYSRDNSYNEKEDSVSNMKVGNNKDNDHKYKEKKSQAINSNELVINKNSIEMALIERLISINFSPKEVNYVIDTITSCRKRMIYIFKNKIKNTKQK